MLLQLLSHTTLDHEYEENNFNTTLFDYLSSPQKELVISEIMKDICFNSLVHHTNLKKALDVALQNLDQKVNLVIIDPFETMTITSAYEKVSGCQITISIIVFIFLNHKEAAFF